MVPRWYLLLTSACIVLWLMSAANLCFGDAHLSVFLFLAGLNIITFDSSALRSKPVNKLELYGLGVPLLLITIYSGILAFR